MKLILVGTDRQGSFSRKVGNYLLKLYEAEGEKVQLLDLAEIELMKEMAGPHYGKSAPVKIQTALDLVTNADGLIVITPEYNGSMPGALKYFIDHMKFPEAFEFRPVCFIGLGGMFGGLRPVEHLQQVFGYRNAFIFPLRIFIMNVFKVWNDEGPVDGVMKKLITDQTKGFIKFCHALKTHGLDANTVLAKKQQQGAQV